jgi:uncharacterized cupredoxin-like copper-binding protein
MKRSVFITVAACAAVLAPGAGAALAAPAAHTASKATTVTVAASEFKFKLSKTSVPKGSVTFVVTNKGKIVHDFKINGKVTPRLQPGKSAKLVVKFAKAGKFAYLCTVPGHAAAGMKGTLTVKA